jgi:hypothetical protein
MIDPFHEISGYMLRPVPTSFPGTCNRHRSPTSLSISIKLHTVFKV